MTAVNMVNFDLNPEKSRLYCFDRKSHSLEIIDLENLALLDQVEFSKDGPDALSGFQQKLISFGKDEIFIMGLEKSGIYTSEGKLLKEIPLRPNQYNLPDDSKYVGFKNDLVFLNDSTILTGILNMQEINPYLVKLHLNRKELTHYQYKSSLTPDTKVPAYKSLVSTPEEFRQAMKVIEEQIEFGRWYWDDVNQLFLRLSYYRLPNQSEVNKANVYLTVFDQEFKMLGEMQLPDYNKVPGKLFVKGGMIWIHENVDEELDFVRLKVIIG